MDATQIGSGVRGLHRELSEGWSVNGKSGEKERGAHES
jgi:hypothetical protein